MSFKMRQKKILVLLTVLMVGLYVVFVGFACIGTMKAYGATDKARSVQQGNSEINEKSGSRNGTSTNKEIEGKK